MTALSPHTAPRPGPTAPSTGPRNRSLDGLRGLALLGMLAWHAEVGWVRGGFARMTIFFVLSGYLAAASYLRMTEAGAHRSFRRFWRRRTLRLLPVTVLGVAFAMVVTVAVGSQAAREDMRGDALSVLGYVSNWRFITDERAYGELFERPSAFMHYWSLSIEEQSFLLLPLVLALALVAARRHPALRLLVVGGLATACILVPLVVPHTPDQAYFGTHVRFGEFLVGVLLALVLSGRTTLPGRVRTGVSVAGLASLVLLLWVMLAVDRDLGWLYRGGLGLFAIPAALVVAACVTGAPTVQRILSVRPLTGIGVWALSVYVLHWPLYLLVEDLAPGLDHAALATLQIALAIVVGGVVHHLYERPLMPGTRPPGRLLAGLRRPPERAVLAGSAAAVVAVALVALVLPVPEDPYDFAGVAAAQRERRDAVAPSVPAPVPAPVPTPPPEAAGAGVEPTRVAVFGGSTALMLALGLDHWAAATEEVATVPGWSDLGCGLLVDVRRFRADGLEELASDGCDDWERNWPTAVSRGDAEVALVVLGVWDTLDLLLDGEDSVRAVGDPVVDSRLADALRRAADVLTGAGARRVVFATTPVIRRDVWEERGLDDDHPRRVQRFNELLAAVAADREDVVVFDYGSWVAGLDPEDAVGFFPDGVHPTWESSERLWRAGLGDATEALLRIR